MPTYLLHGFRWTRPAIRIHVILNDIDDAAPEWLVAPATTTAMLDNLRHLFPDTLAGLPGLRFIEQYDPDDETIKSQPFAYVADVVVDIKLGVEVADITGRGVTNEQWEAMMDLRDHLQKDAKVTWYVVVCGDEERWVPPQSPPSEGDEDLETSTTSPKSPTASKSSGSRSDTFASSSKSTQYTSSPVSTREQKNKDQRSLPPAKATSSSRTKTSSDSRSSTKPAPPPPVSRTTTTESRGKQKERDPEIRRQRSSSIGKGLRKVFGMKESKSNRNLRDDARYDDRQSPPPMPRKR